MGNPDLFDNKTLKTPASPLVDISLFFIQLKEENSMNEDEYYYSFGYNKLIYD